MLNTRLIPRSRATNIYELLGEVIELIRTEPDRIAMTQILCVGDPGSGGRVQDWGRNSPVRCVPIPECGAQGCIVGWVRVLLGRPQFGEGTILWGDHSMKLSPSHYKAYQEFQDMCWNNVGMYPWPDEKLPQRDYARAVIANIEKYRERNKTALIERKIR